MTSPAPIILFVYNRPQFTRQTLEALAANYLAAESDLYVFADGPRDGSTPEQLETIAKVHTLVREARGFKSVHLQVSPKNKGLANSVIDGISLVLQQFEAAIVIEDDVITSPWFLHFMNDALALYATDSRVMSIGSWNYYYTDALMDSFFTHLPDTIAWATWRRSWELFEKNEQLLYQQLQQQKLLYHFNLQGRFPYETMLQQQIAGKVNSWAIRWTANALLQHKLCLYPNRSLSKHIGFGADSTHVKSADYNADLLLATSRVQVGGIPVVHNPAAIEAFIHFEREIRPLKTSRKKQLRHRLRTAVHAFKKPLKQWLKKPGFGWFGNYASWEAAMADTTGYDQQNILEKVQSAVLQVKNGTAVYERDGVLFSHKEYSQPLVSSLLYVASRYQNSLSVLDFGGSLGSSYFQNKQILDELYGVKWTVVEQANFIESGRQHIADDILQFFETVDEAIEQRGRPNLLMLSCTLPYIEQPYHLLQFLASKKIPYLLIENTPFHHQKGDRLTVQKVNPLIYDASYPCWFLDKQAVINSMAGAYKVIMDQPTGTTISLDGNTIPYQSILFELL